MIQFNHGVVYDFIVKIILANLLISIGRLLTTILSMNNLLLQLLAQIVRSW